MMAVVGLGLVLAGVFSAYFAVKHQDTMFGRIMATVGLIAVVLGMIAVILAVGEVLS